MIIYIYINIYMYPVIHRYAIHRYIRIHTYMYICMILVQGPALPAPMVLTWWPWWFVSFFLPCGFVASWRCKIHMNNVVKTIPFAPSPRKITIFLDGVTTIPSRLGGLWHGFNHMTCSERPESPRSPQPRRSLSCAWCGIRWRRPGKSGLLLSYGLHMITYPLVMDNIW